MDFTPHTEADVARMLTRLGLKSTAELFGHLPAGVPLPAEIAVPSPLSEPEVMQLVEGLASQNRSELICFAGGGIYDHFLPPVVRALTMRPEFVTAYTPYQPEVSQGTLQLLFEYQSMLCAATGMDAANASLYDGATAGVEAAGLAVAATGRSSIWLSRGVHPHTREALRTVLGARRVAIQEQPLVGGITAWSDATDSPPAALIFSQPNYLGVVEPYSTAVERAQQLGALTVSSIDPIALGVLTRPGEAGVDVVFGEGQALGNPMSFGGPVVGWFATTTQHVRRIPGRVVGATHDLEGRPGFVMTLRTREQDIRREKASSNICTNQTLNAIACLLQMAWLGPAGLAEVATQSAHKARYLAEALNRIPGVRPLVPAPFLREFALGLPLAAEAVVAAMAERGFLAGIPLGRDYPELGDGLLVAVTERRSRAELDRYAAALGEVVSAG